MFAQSIVCMLGMLAVSTLLLLCIVCWCAEHDVHPLRNALGRFRRLPRFAKVFLACFVLAYVVYGSTKSDGGATNPPPLGMSAPLRLLHLIREAVTSNDVERGYRISDVTDGGSIVPVPTGAVTNEALLRRGGFDWAFRVEPNGWRFPYGGGFIDGVTVMARGEVRPDIGTLYFPVPVTNGVSLLPEARWNLLLDGEASVFSHAVTAEGSLLLDWRNALVGRDPNCPTNLQMELFRDGSFAWRTDGGSRFYLPVFPFDWDGDGFENSVDPDPLVANSADAHGTNPEWHGIVCSNVFENVGGAVRFKEDVNSNAYYFAEVVAEEGPAPIRFDADRDSRLGSPVVVAQPGETNRVPLLIGVEYAVTSTVPISVSVLDSMYAVVTTNGLRSASVRWPLEFAFVEGIGASNRTYTARVGPYDPGGEFIWGGPQQDGGPMLMSASPNPSCACYTALGNTVTYSCSSTCSCGGDCAATGSYRFEAAMFSVTGGVCRCGFDDPPPPDEPYYDLLDGPGFSIDFSKSAVIFEDAYEDSPGVTKPKRSTRVRLTISAYGGPNGGTFLLTHQNLDKLNAVADGPIQLPSSKTLAPGEGFCTTCVYEAEEASGEEDDIYVWGYFIEDETFERYDANGKLTAVKAELRVVRTAPENPCENRHQYGICEMVHCVQEPSSPQIDWQAKGYGSISNSSPVSYICPIRSETGGVLASIGSVDYKPQIQVVEPDGLECRRYGFLQANVMTGIGMALELYVSPSSVSFEEIELQEVAAPPNATSPEWGVHTGYFSDPAYQLRWYHYSCWGAGSWVVVNSGNRWGDYDQSRMFTWAQPWTTGHMTWNIPIAWRRKHHPNEGEGGRMPTIYTSEWTMTDEFIVKRKHGLELTLSEGGQIFLHGDHYVEGQEDD